MDDVLAPIIAVLFLVASLIFMIIGIDACTVQYPNYKERAVEVGFAHYDSQTAELIWDDKNCGILN